MAKKKELKEEPKLEEPKEEKAEPIKVETKKREAKELLVILPDGRKRLYREATHGKVYAILAKQLANNPKYKGAKIVEL